MTAYIEVAGPGAGRTLGVDRVVVKGDAILDSR